MRKDCCRPGLLSCLWFIWGGGGKQFGNVVIFYFGQAIFQRLGLGFSGTLKYLVGYDIDQIRNRNKFSRQIPGQPFMHVDINQPLVSNQIVSGDFG